MAVIMGMGAVGLTAGVVGILRVSFIVQIRKNYFNSFILALHCTYF
jgi:hypothetical protein